MPDVSSSSPIPISISHEGLTAFIELGLGSSHDACLETMGVLETSHSHFLLENCEVPKENIAEMRIRAGKC